MSLAPAIAYEDGLRAAWARAALDPRFRFFFGIGGWTYVRPVLSEKTWDYVQLVSVVDGGVVGFFSAEIDRPPRCVSEMGWVNLAGKPSFAFARDSSRFLRALFEEHGMFAVRWTVVVGNPAEKMYDRLVANRGGRIIGFERGAVVLQDQRRYDRKRYEILASEVRL